MVTLPPAVRNARPVSQGNPARPGSRWSTRRPSAALSGRPN